MIRQKLHRYAAKQNIGFKIPISNQQPRGKRRGIRPSARINPINRPVR